MFFLGKPLGQEDLKDVAGTDLVPRDTIDGYEGVVFQRRFWQGSAL
jgi:hypothetical protein